MANEPDNDSISFWDGKTYSSSELNRALPGLAAIARTNPVLAEQWPMWRLKYANGFLAVAGGLALVLCGPLLAVWGAGAVCYGIDAIEKGPLELALVVGGFLLALGAFQWGLGLLLYPNYRPIVMVKDGTVTVQTGDGQFHLTANLKECCWYHGYVTDTALISTRTGIIFKARAIVIRFPRQSRFEFYRQHIAVGLTDEYHAIWQAFLKLTEIPQIPNKRAEPPPPDDASDPT